MTIEIPQEKWSEFFNDADLIVTGSHGKGFFDRMLFGSVSDFVVYHAPCSVLVVRSGNENKE